MAALFQIRRGSGSVNLSAGELYTNQTSRSLQLGIVDSGSIVTLAKLNETNSGSFDISGNLFVSGNARIVGNLTFGDSDALDTVTIVASFSSSLIPQSNNNFDLGDTTTYWKNGYITSITGSLNGNVNGIDITTFSQSVSQSIGTLNNTTAQYGNKINNLEQHSSSVNNFTASITTSYNATSESLNVISQSLVNVSASYIVTSHSFNSVSSSLLTFSSSQYNADSSSFNNRLDLVEATASVLTTFSASISTSVGLLQHFSSSQYNADSTSFDSRLDAVQSYTASLKAAFEVSGSGVGSLTTIYGDLRVEGTQSIINSENLAVKDNLIYLNDSSSITNPDLGIVGNYNDGTYAHSGIYRESVGGKWRVFTGLTDEPSGSINSGHPSFQLADFEANEVSASINGIGRVGAYSASVNSRTTNLEATASNVVSRVISIETYTASVSTSVGLLQQFSGSEYKNDSSSFDSRLDLVEATASYLNTTFSTSVDSRGTLLETTASYLYTTFSSSVDSRLDLTEATASYLNTTFSTSVDSRIDSLENFSASQYINDSSSFNTRISASTLTFNDTSNQIGIDFTQVGTQVSAIASGLTTTSNVQFSSITASYVSASGTIYCDTLVADTLVGATLPVLEYETNGTLGNILIKGATSKSIQVVDTIAFTGMTQNGLDQFSATGLYMTGSITASTGFSGSINGIGNVTEYSASVDSRLDTLEFNDTRFATTGSNTFKDDQVISGSIYVTGDVVAYSTSDERLKDNIQLICNPIEKVNQLRGVEFDWNDKSMFKAGKHDYGVIAQDVEKVLPELVKETHTGYLGVDYDKIVGLLIEVVKEQEKRIKDLENKLSS